MPTSPSLSMGANCASAGTVADSGWFRYHFLEASVLTALDCVFFVPIHAACVSSSERGLLLCGDSGAGKSSLAYACGRAGWTFVSDDAVHLVPGDNQGVVVGDPHRFRLREASQTMFPGVAAFPSALRPNGQSAIEIATSALPDIRCNSTARITDCVCLTGGLAARAWHRDGGEQPINYMMKSLHWGDAVLQRLRLSALLEATKLWTLEYEAIGDAVRELELLRHG